jgi:predicted XRE-type DNA-binding protein
VEKRMNKLTYQETLHIRKLYENGVKQVDIAKKFHVAQATISAIIHKTQKAQESHEISYADVKKNYPEYKSIFDTVIKRHVSYKRFIGNKLVYDRDEIVQAFDLYQQIRNKEYLDMPQIAVILQVTRQRVVQLLQEGALHSIMFGARRFVLQQEVYGYKKLRDELRRASWWEKRHAETN